jgi:hypothetical protein
VVDRSLRARDRRDRRDGPRRRRVRHRPGVHRGSATDRFRIVRDVTTDVWLRYGRWLVAGLTFQLAADIIETSITANWEAIGRIAAIAAVRTFLDYFLERNLAEVREAAATDPRSRPRSAPASR